MKTPTLGTRGNLAFASAMLLALIAIPAAAEARDNSDATNNDAVTISGTCQATDVDLTPEQIAAVNVDVAATVAELRAANVPLTEFTTDIGLTDFVIDSDDVMVWNTAAAILDRHDSRAIRIEASGVPSGDGPTFEALGSAGGSNDPGIPPIMIGCAVPADGHAEVTESSASFGR